MKGYMNYIDVNPKIMLGKPVIKGTWLTVELILEANYDVHMLWSLVQEQVIHKS